MKRYLVYLTRSTDVAERIAKTFKVGEEGVERTSFGNGDGGVDVDVIPKVYLDEGYFHCIVTYNEGGKRKTLPLGTRVKKAARKSARAIRILKGDEVMTRFTKYTLRAAALILIATATASAVTYAYGRRGYFTFGGEWLIPAVTAIIWAIGREIKRIFCLEKEQNHGHK